MKVNRNNYEIYFIDYYDGKLPAEDIADLFLFLAGEPDLKAEFENFADVKLDSGKDENIFSGKNALRRGIITDENCDWYFAASLEGDLTKDEETALEIYISSNPEAVRQKRLYSLTRLSKDEVEIFEGKSNLKHPVPLYVNNRRTISFAIAAILLLGIIASSVFIYMKSEQQGSPRIAVSPEVMQPANISPADSPKPEKILNKDETIVKKEIKILPRKAAIINDTAPLTASDNIDSSVIKINPVQPIYLAVILQPDPEVEIAYRENELPVSQQTEIIPSEEYMTVWEAIRSASVEKLKDAGRQNDAALASIDNSQDIKLIDVVGKGLNVISKDKVRLNSDYDEVEQKSTFRFSVGNFRIEKN